MVDSREYLVVRYGPELVDRASQTNRLAATLEEVASKVRELMSRGGGTLG